MTTCADLFPAEYLQTPQITLVPFSEDKEFIAFVKANFGCAISGRTDNLEWHHLPYRSRGNAASDYMGILLTHDWHEKAHKMGIAAFLKLLNELKISLTSQHNQYITAYIKELKSMRSR